MMDENPYQAPRATKLEADRAPALPAKRDRYVLYIIAFAYITQQSASRFNENRSPETLAWLVFVSVILACNVVVLVVPKMERTLDRLVWMISVIIVLLYCAVKLAL